MNEGENTGMPKAPDFSSPNTSPENPAPIQPAAPADSQPAQPAASVYSAAASLPEEDPSQPTQAISSGGPSARPRFGFTRKFKNQQPAQPRTAAFNNAPDFFNQAVGDIVVANDNAVAQKQKTKKFIILSAAVLGVLAIVLVVVFFIGQASKPSANKVKTAFNRYANYVLYGEEKDSDIGEYSRATRYTIMDKYIDIDEGYNKRYKELFDAFYKAYNDAAGSGLYKKGSMDNFKEFVYAVYDSFEMSSAYSTEKILSDYSSLGKGTTTKNLEEKFEQYKKNESKKYLFDWYETRTEYIKLLDAYASRGCLVTEEIDSTCAAEADKDPSIIAIKSKLTELSDDEVSSRIGIRNMALKMLWNVKDQL